MNEAKKLDLIFSALSHSTRRALLKTLSRGDQSVLTLAKPHQMSLNAVSKHIKKLEEAGLIQRNVDGSYHHISLKPETLKMAFKWMSHYTPFWSEQLESLKKYVEGNK